MGRAIQIKQHDITDCGAACLASVSAHYALRLPVTRIRQLAGTDKRGTNVLGLLEAAGSLGFEAKAVRAAPDNLKDVPLPAIAHMNLKDGYQHFVVVYKASSSRVTCMDPRDGSMRTKSLEDFGQEWSGVLILLVPDESIFRKGNEKVSNASRFWMLLKPHRAVTVQAFVGTVVYSLLGLSTSIYVQKIVDNVLVEGNMRLLNLLSIIMVALLAFQLILGFIKNVMVLQTSQRIDAGLILGYYKHLLNLPQRFFDTMRVGEIISRVNDAVKIRLFINEVSLSLMVNIMIVIFSFSLMFVYYWKLAMLMLAIIPVYALFYWINNRINKKWQRRIMENSADVETQLVESLNAASTIKRFGLENFSNAKTETRFYGLMRSSYKTSVYNLYLGSFAEFVTRFFAIAVLWAGSYFVIGKELSPGELLSFFALIGYFTGPAASLIGANKQMQDALIASDRLFEIIDLETEKSSTEIGQVKLTPALAGNIVFKNVHFRYNNRADVFKGLNIEIERGKITAIVGESGSGKSTILSLVQNLYPITAGNITIGGIDLQHISNESLRAITGVVPQKTDLFAGTIVENIALGDYDPDIERILMLCRMLGMQEFIEKLPGGYHTILNEQGVNLSGGQRQRVAIARALYRNPEILILDEATSSLDGASEEFVHDAVSWYRQQGKTIIIIAHRLSTVKNADKIFVLSNGEVVQEGSHEGMIAVDGYYKTMWMYNSGTLTN